MTTTPALSPASSRTRLLANRGPIWMPALVALAVMVFVSGCATNPESKPAATTASKRPALREKSAAEAHTLAASGDANARNAKGETALHLACLAGDASLVESLLQRGADIGARTADGDTPLHRAAHSTNPEPARLLIERKADVNARSEKGTTPLHDAAMSSPAVAALLLAHGADIRATNIMGNTPLHFAALIPPHYERMRPILTEGGVNPDARNVRGETAQELYVQSAARWKKLVEAAATRAAQGQAVSGLITPQQLNWGAQQTWFQTRSMIQYLGPLRR